MRVNRRLVPIVITLSLTTIINLSGGISGTANALDIFGCEVGNEYSYDWTDQQGTYKLVDEVIRVDQITFPTTTYIVEEKKNGNVDGRSWYEKTPYSLKIWGMQDFSEGGFFRFSSGLVCDWSPMQVGDKRYSSGTVEIDLYPGIILNVSLTVTVLNKEPVSLIFDTLEAYKRRIDLRIWGYGEDETLTTYDWVVPYINTIKEYDPEDRATELITSFSIGGGVITEATDSDVDGLKDYQELIIYKTNRENSDTDGDKMPDGWEVQYGLNPLEDDASLDKDSDGYSNLQEFRGRSDPNDPNSYPSIAMPWIPLLLLDD
jgi:hypothetical protein